VRPAWIKSAAIGQWAQIAGTPAPGELGDYCGMGLRESGGVIEVASLASGGHGGNLTNNSVKSLRLDVDAPSWVVRRGPSDATGWNTTGVVTAYFPSDNRPAPRHTYWHTWWVPELDRYVIFGGRFWGSSAGDWWKTDAFNPNTNDWDPPGTYADSTGKAVSARNPLTGVLYATYGSLATFDPKTKTFSAGLALSGTGTVARAGNAFDTKRGFLYHLSTGDNFSQGGAINSAKIDPVTAKTTAVTFRPSAAWSDFQANATKFLGTTLVYDNDLDRYYFYNGGAEGPAKVYRITPSAGDTWDMDFITVTGLTPAPSGGGVNTKFVYVSALRACVLVVPGKDVYFVKTS
jgi:hypothetical protein